MEKCVYSLVHPVVRVLKLMFLLVGVLIFDNAALLPRQGRFEERVPELITPRGIVGN